MGAPCVGRASEVHSCVCVSWLVSARMLAWSRGARRRPFAVSRASPELNRYSFNLIEEPRLQHVCVQQQAARI